ncbi:hypothetical protein SRHO_G00020880 [Serrasalmus rhombeus]
MCLSAVSRRALPSPGPTALSLFPAVFELRSEGSVLAHSAWVDQGHQGGRAKAGQAGHFAAASACNFHLFLCLCLCFTFPVDPTDRGDEHFKSGKEDMEGRETVKLA